MTHSSRHDPKIKAIAEVLAMIADAHPQACANHPPPARMSDDWLFENATEFVPRWTFMPGGRHQGLSGPCLNARRRDKSQAQARRAVHLKSYQIDGRLLRTGAANFSASGLTRYDNHLNLGQVTAASDQQRCHSSP